MQTNRSHSNCSFKCKLLRFWVLQKDMGLESQKRSGFQYDLSFDWLCDLEKIT